MGYFGKGLNFCLSVLCDDGHWKDCFVYNFGFLVWSRSVMISFVSFAVEQDLGQGDAWFLLLQLAYILPLKWWFFLGFRCLGLAWIRHFRSDTDLFFCFFEHGNFVARGITFEFSTLNLSYYGQQAWHCASYSQQLCRCRYFCLLHVDEGFYIWITWVSVSCSLFPNQSFYA